jgi:hypothetical protein
MALMQTLLLAILGALVGGGYEAFQTIELMRTGAYSPAQGIGVILVGAIVGAAVFATASAAHRRYLSRK